MGSTVCVRCGATLIPHSYCDVCQDVLRFVCSSCSMYTDERIHTYCRSTRIQNNYDIRKLVQIPNTSQIVLNDSYSYIQNQLSDEIKYNSLNLLSRIGTVYLNLSNWSIDTGEEYLTLVSLVLR